MTTSKRTELFPPVLNTQSSRSRESGTRRRSSSKDFPPLQIQSSDKQVGIVSPTTKLPLPSSGTVGCLLLIATLMGAVWYFWPQTKSPALVCEPQWVQTASIDEKLELTVEEFGTTNGIVAILPSRGSGGPGVGLGKTTLSLAVRNLPDSSGAFLRKAEDAYLTDSRGTRYDLWVDSSGSHGNGIYAHQLLRNEVYRFDLSFPEIGYETPFIHFNHPQFQPMKITLKW